VNILSLCASCNASISFIKSTCTIWSTIHKYKILCFLIGTNSQSK
jgi:hypothetical protein